MCVCWVIYNTNTSTTTTNNDDDDDDDNDKIFTTHTSVISVDLYMLRRSLNVCFGVFLWIKK